MIFIIDVLYKESNTARAVGVLCDWDDLEPKQVVIEQIEEVEPYEPGQFFKRELPCIMKLLEKINLKTVETIVDGHVYVDNNYGYGLGGHLWQSLEVKVPIIGVAKRGFYSNKETVVEVLRGKSSNPLHVSAIGMDKSIAANKILEMPGDYRMPRMLKLVDTITRE